MYFNQQFLLFFLFLFIFKCFFLLAENVYGGWMVNPFKDYVILREKRALNELCNRYHLLIRLKMENFDDFSFNSNVCVCVCARI